MISKGSVKVRHRCHGSAELFGFGYCSFGSAESWFGLKYWNKFRPNRMVRPNLCMRFGRIRRFGAPLFPVYIDRYVVKAKQCICILLVSLVVLTLRTWCSNLFVGYIFSEVLLLFGCLKLLIFLKLLDIFDADKMTRSSDKSTHYQ